MTPEEKLQAYKGRLAEKNAAKIDWLPSLWTVEDLREHAKKEFLAGIEAGERLGLLRGKIEEQKYIRKYCHHAKDAKAALERQVQAEAELESLIKEGQ